MGNLALTSQSPVRYLHPFIARGLIVRRPIPLWLLTQRAINSRRFFLCYQPSAK